MAGILTCTLAGCASKPLLRNTQLMMGTFVEVVSADKQAAAIVFAEMKRIEGLLSVYDPQSEIARLNASGSIRASDETMFVIKKAVEFCRASEGAFDITVGPLVELWGFRDKKYRHPSDEEIASALRTVGCGKLLIDEQAHTVSFSVAGMKVDLGGIAKGYALDCAAGKLRESGITGCLINAGGQVYGLGGNNNRPWRITVKRPRSRGTTGAILLRGMSASTSADYEQFFSFDGKRFSHIMDPHTGSPAESGLQSVTVIAGDALTADALSTAIFVLGKKGGEELARRFPGVRVIFQP